MFNMSPGGGPPSVGEVLPPPSAPGLDPRAALDPWAQAKAREYTVGRSSFLTEQQETATRLGSPFVAPNAPNYGGDNLSGRWGAIGEIQQSNQAGGFINAMTGPVPRSPFVEASAQGQPPGLARGALGQMSVCVGQNNEGSMGCQKLMNKSSDKLKTFFGTAGGL